jgi:hypothetical protein
METTSSNPLPTFDYSLIERQLNVIETEDQSHIDAIEIILNGLENEHRMHWIDTELFEQGLPSTETIFSHYNIKTMSEQKSPILFGKLKQIAINGNLETLKTFQIALDAVYALGELEHSSDWDPFLTLELATTDNIESASGSNSDLDELLSGNTFHSEHGYGEFAISEDGESIDILTALDSDMESDDAIVITIPIKDILTISVTC